MAATPYEPTFAARCGNCGGTVPIVLAGPPIVCPFCRSERPLEPSLAQRVENLRTRLSRRSGREQQLMGRQTQLAHTFGLFYLVALLSVFLLFILPLPFAIELPKGTSFLAFLTEVQREPESWATIGPNTYWWYFTLMLFGISIIVVSWALMAFRMRRVQRFAYPEAPLSPGRPPRCRVCGAEIEGDGSVRRCRYCRADHIVMGERYQAHRASLDKALSQHEAQIEKSLESREKAAETSTSVAGGVSVFGMIAAATAAPFLGDTRPSLLLVPLGVMGGAALALLVQRLVYPMPEIPDIYSVGSGKLLDLRGVRFEVLGAYIPEVSNKELLRHRLLLLGNGGAKEPVAALLGSYDTDGILHVRAFSRRPEAAFPTKSGVPSSFSPKDKTTLWPEGGKKLWVDGGDQSLAIWVNRPRPEAPSRLAFEAMSPPLESADIFLL